MSSDNRPVNTSLRVSAQGVNHYENFPVASWLCPPRLRRPVAAIYGFARTADDMADEGMAPAAERLADLTAYRADLDACFSGRPDSGRWPGVFIPLRSAVRDFALPQRPLDDLLAAFEQDVARSRDGAGYATRAELLDYCGRSANPVGRLLLHLYGVTDARAQAQSDAVCTALQLINFWQDVGLDVVRGRYYLPAEDLQRHGIDPARPSTWATHREAPKLIAEFTQWARSLMESGAGVVHRVPGRAGWELRLVVQGGLRILERIESTGCNSFAARPTLRVRDVAVMLWRSLRM
ncbi:MAG: phytoene synthase-like protein [Ramlibacter sp.]|jgi:squalene synthase HpnC|nr:phytoene synthase-like protein [Ramlibacter sp.]